MKVAPAINKVLSKADLLKLAENWRASGLRIVFTNGVFDLLHIGHLKSIETASSFGDRLVIGVNSDASARQLGKGPDRPLNRAEDRALLLAGLTAVDAVTIFEELTPWELLRDLRPDTIAKGGDYQIDQIVGREFADRVERIDLAPGYSTTNLVKRIKADEA